MLADRLEERINYFNKHLILIDRSCNTWEKSKYSGKQKAKPKFKQIHKNAKVLHHGKKTAKSSAEMDWFPSFYRYAVSSNSCDIVKNFYKAIGA